MASNVPKLQITKDGVVVPETQAVLNGVLNDFNDAFGGNLNITSVATPQSVLSSDITQAITDTNANLAYYISQVDPDKAEGRMQDAIARIYLLYRKPATATKVVAECVGTANAILPIGSIAEDYLTGYQYITTEEHVFGLDGKVNATFYCTTLGAIPCAIGALNKIPKYVVNWDSVVNLDTGEVGRDVESRLDFEYRRKLSVAKNSHGSVSAIWGAVAALEDVDDVFAVENTSSDPSFYGYTRYPLKPHSICVSVVGGNDEEIAKTIWLKKDCGCDYNGNTTISVVDDSTFANFPPTYEVKFLRPTETPIYFKVSIFDSGNLPANVTDLIKDAIINNFYGADGGERVHLGNVIYTTRFIAAVASVGTGILINNVRIGFDFTVMGSFVSLGIDQAPTLDATHIQVDIISNS